MVSRFHTIPVCHGQTDGRTDRIAISISRVSVLTHDKNVCISVKFVKALHVDALVRPTIFVIFKILISYVRLSYPSVSLLIDWLFVCLVALLIPYNTDNLLVWRGCVMVKALDLRSRLPAVPPSLLLLLLLLLYSDNALVVIH